MKNLVTGLKKAAAPVAFALVGLFGASSSASACTDNNGQPISCGPVPGPIIVPSPSNTGNTTNSPTANSTSGATSTSGAVAGAVSGSNSISGASAGIKTGDIGSTSGASAGVKTGNIGSTSGVSTGAIGSTSSAKTGDSTSGVTTGAIGSTSSSKSGDSNSSAKTGDVNVDGSNNSQYNSSTVYKAAASTALSNAAGTTGHGCFRGKGGVSLGVQTVAGGASVTVGGGEEYELVKMKVTNAKGEVVEIDGNPCAIDQVTLAAIAAGATPFATDAQVAYGAQVAAEASPAAGRAMDKVMANDNLVNKFARKSYAPVTNNYPVTIVDKTGTVVSTDCPPGTKPILDRNGAPTFDANGRALCGPG